MSHMTYKVKVEYAQDAENDGAEIVYVQLDPKDGAEAKAIGEAASYVECHFGADVVACRILEKMVGRW